jgi:hypothetical protein
MQDGKLVPEHGDLYRVRVRRRTTAERAEHLPDDHQYHHADHHDLTLPARYRCSSHHASAN